MRNIRSIVVAMGLGLAACGGGGGGSGGTPGSAAEIEGGPDVDRGVLEVSVSWGGGAEIFHAAHIAATLNGFRGHTPKCTLVSGSLPPGLQLQSDCAITGRPVATGTWYLTVRVAAAGVSGTLDFTAEGAVYGPTVAYDRLSFSPPHVPLGTEMRTAPEIESWNVDPDVPPTWTYEAASTLPPGLQLDPVTA